MSFRTFKVLKAATQLVGMIGGIVAMRNGADPLIAFGMMAFMWGGPEAIEVVLETGGGQDQTQTTSEE